MAPEPTGEPMRQPSDLEDVDRLESMREVGTPWSADSEMALEDEEPSTLEIQYPGHGGEGGLLKEVVFEDPNKGMQERPRLLVSLKSVSALKTLCEQEFAKVQLAYSTLSRCRSDYYKELLYLREQLYLSRRPEQAMMIDAVKNYEVYYFTPPNYVDAPTAEFLQDCVRWNNAKLIEENMELSMKLGGKDVGDFGDPDMALKTLLKRLGGARGLLRKFHGHVSSPQHGSPQQLQELQATAQELFPELSKGDSSKSQVYELQDELDRLRPKAQEADRLRKELESLRAGRDEDRLTMEQERQRVIAERQRAEEALRAVEAEQKRAEEALAKVASLEQELAAARDRLSQLQAGSSGLKQFNEAADVAAGRIRAVVTELRRMSTARPSVAAPSAASARSVRSVHDGLEDAVSSLEQAATAAAQGASGATASMQDQIRRLEAQLKQAKEAEEKAKKEALAARQKGGTSVNAGELADLKAELQRAQEALEQATKEAERASKAEAALLKERDKLAAEKARLEELSASLAQEGKGGSAAVEELKKQLAGKEAANEKLREKLKDLQAKYEEADEMALRLQRKLTAAQDKIIALKKELKEWKLKCGVEVEESEESEEEEELPSFLTSYYQRIKNSPKPRWLLLSEDATLLQRKKDWLWSQRYHVVAETAADEASSALKFLRRQPQPLPVARQKSSGGKVRNPYAALYAASLANADEYSMMSALAGPFSPTVEVPSHLEQSMVDFGQSVVHPSLPLMTPVSAAAEPPARRQGRSLSPDRSPTEEELLAQIEQWRQRDATAAFSMTDPLAFQSTNTGRFSASPQRATVISPQSMARGGATQQNVATIRMPEQQPRDLAAPPDGAVAQHQAAEAPTWPVASASRPVAHLPHSMDAMNRPLESQPHAAEALSGPAVSGSRPVASFPHTMDTASRPPAFQPHAPEVLSRPAVSTSRPVAYLPQAMDAMSRLLAAQPHAGETPGHPAASHPHAAEAPSRIAPSHPPIRIAASQPPGAEAPGRAAASPSRPAAPQLHAAETPSLRAASRARAAEATPPGRSREAPQDGERSASRSGSRSASRSGSPVATGNALLLPLKPPTPWSMQPLAAGPQDPSAVSNVSQLGRAIRAGHQDRPPRDGSPGTAAGPAATSPVSPPAQRLPMRRAPASAPAGGEPRGDAPEGAGAGTPAAAGAGVGPLQAAAAAPVPAPEPAARQHLERGRPGADASPSAASAASPAAASPSFRMMLSSPAMRVQRSLVPFASDAPPGGGGGPSAGAAGAALRRGATAGVQRSTSAAGRLPDLLGSGGGHAEPHTNRVDAPVTVISPKGSWPVREPILGVRRSRSVATLPLTNYPRAQGARGQPASPSKPRPGARAVASPSAGAKAAGDEKATLPATGDAPEGSSFEALPRLPPNQMR